jgi:hypothetical protein
MEADDIMSSTSRGAQRRWGIEIEQLLLVMFASEQNDAYEDERTFCKVLGCENGNDSMRIGCV